MNLEDVAYAEMRANETGRETTLVTRRTWPAGWIEVHKFRRVGDEVRPQSWAGPLLTETEQFWAIEIGYEPWLFDRDNWIGSKSV